jgi:hypothetical protein
VCVCERECVSVCVCVRERESWCVCERESVSVCERERECVSVCVCEREREFVCVSVCLTSTRQLLFARHFVLYRRSLSLGGNRLSQVPRCLKAMHVGSMADEASS